MDRNEPHRRRYKKHEIPVEAWAEMQRMDQAGCTLGGLTDWLEEHYQMRPGQATMSRFMAKLRASAPVPEPVWVAPNPPPPVPPPPPGLEPATDADELAVVRKFARDQMLYGADWKAQQGGASLLLRVRAEDRATREATRIAASREEAAQPVAQALIMPTFGIKPDLELNN
jgi:hypothetical protein